METGSVTQGGKIEMANLKVTLVKSTIGSIPKHKKTVEALGLRRQARQSYCRTMQLQEVWYSR